MSIAFVAGTTAEIIKLAPVMLELRERGLGYVLWSTDQHVSGMQETLENLGLPQPDVHLVPERRRVHVAAAGQVPGWVASVLSGAVRQRRALRRAVRAQGRPIVVVHGDTFTTVLGSLVGRFIGARVAHVEAGMRSGDIRHPFPEELNRRLAARIATLHFAPTAREAANLKRERVRGEVVETGENTAVDALRLMLQAAPAEADLPERFGLVTLHRFELVRDARAFSAIISTLAGCATPEQPLLMVAGKAERARITELGLEGLFGDDFRLLAKRPYAEFLPLLAAADFVVTDSGGLQQECAVLGKPCAIHRERTETHQGLGENVVLTGLDTAVVRRFVREWESHRRPSTLDEHHPSQRVAEILGEALTR